VVRHDTNLESISKMSQLPDDMSPFQLGTSGIYQGFHFVIIGRLKKIWQDGNWNEWFLYFNDAKKAWLAEAQGTLAIIFEVYLSAEEAKTKFAVMPQLKEKVKIFGINYTVCDIKNSVCAGSEGELPFVAVTGRKVKSVDLTSGEQFAGIEYVENEPPVVFTGKYVEFDELSFSHLRELEGWKMLSLKLKS
jgi:hypothetical protein